MRVNLLTNQDKMDHLGPAIHLALEYWPNAGGDETRRENIRSAFRFIRNRLNNGMDFYCACGDLVSDAYRYQNM